MIVEIARTVDGYTLQSASGVEIAWRPTYRAAVELQWRIQDIAQDQVAELIEREDRAVAEFLRCA